MCGLYYQEVEAIRKEKDRIIQEYNNNKNKSAPVQAAPVKQEAPKVEPVQVAPVKQEAPKPVSVKQEAPKPAPVQAAPAKQVVSKPVQAKEAPKVQAAPVKQEAPVKAAPKELNSSQPPSKQDWGRGDLLSSCCENYYNLVRQDGNDVNWVLLKHSSNTQVRAEAIGSGGLSEPVALLGEKDTGFIYVRFQTGDAESKRAKFVLVSWCGSKAPIMRKAKMSVHKADVKQIFCNSALEIHATEAGDLDEANILKSLIKAGGANYNGQASQFLLEKK